jgi:SAM-dependent methyltransferase
MTQFDELGRAYERSAEDLPFREHLEMHSVRLAVGDITCLNVLDLGCGSGLYTRRYSQWGAHHVVGLDTSEGMLDVARNHPDTADNVVYVRRDATSGRTESDAEIGGLFDLVASVYVLCYASNMDQLIGFFETSRRALGDSGGRIVAMTLNPEYSRDPDYYRHYGFSLAQFHEREGASVTLTAPSYGDRDFTVTAHWWSAEAYETAARKAGFVKLTWTTPTVSEEGLALFGEEYWSNYVNHPHGLILSAELQPSS